MHTKSNEIVSTEDWFCSPGQYTQIIANLPQSWVKAPASVLEHQPLG